MRVEQMHKRNFLHRDIKPENFLIGCSKKVNQIFVIDFGLSKRFICPKTNEHIELRKTKFIGTPRYSSLNAHMGNEQSRRDDLEAIGNVLIYFFKNGRLPWMVAEDQKVNVNHNLLKAHQNTTFDELIEGCPEWLEKFMSYVKQMSFE